VANTLAYFVGASVTNGLKKVLWHWDENAVQTLAALLIEMNNWFLVGAPVFQKLFVCPIKLPIKTIPFRKERWNGTKEFIKIKQWLVLLYDNECALIIDIYFYEFFQPFQTSSACAPKHLRHPIWCFGKCLRFSLIKIEPVSINPSQAALSLYFFSVVYTFLLK
jgi:hypothetical protein